MALKPDGDRTRIALSVKKTTKETLFALATKHNRSVGKELDNIVEWISTKKEYK